MTVVPKQEENKEAHRSVLSSDKGRKNGLKWKKKKKDIKSCIKIELCKKTKNTFIFTTIITGYIISVFLWVGSWGHIEKENKGKKREFKNNRFAKKFRREILHSQRKKKVIQKAEICYIWFQNHEIGRCKMHININMSRRTNSKCYLRKKN